MEFRGGEVLAETSDCMARLVTELHQDFTVPEEGFQLCG
jgi:hypothetical protein